MLGALPNIQNFRETFCPRLAQPEFTPSDKEVPALVDVLFASPALALESVSEALTDKELRQIGKALVRKREKAGTEILRRLEASEFSENQISLTPDLVRIISQLAAPKPLSSAPATIITADSSAKATPTKSAPKPPAQPNPLELSLQSKIISAISHSDAKVARAAVIAAGKLSLTEAVPAIKSRTLDVAAVQSLSRLGTFDFPKTALGPKSTPNMERVLARAAIMAKRSTAAPADAFAWDRPAKKQAITLHCRGGLEDILCQAAKAVPALEKPEKFATGMVRVHLTGTWRSLQECRLYEHWEIPLGCENGDGTKFLVDKFRDERPTGFRRFVSALMETKGPFRYRLELAGQGPRRGFVWQLASDLHRAWPAAVNDPREAIFEIVFRTYGTLTQVSLRLRKVADERFTSRRLTVSASSHNPLAAALVGLAGVRPDDVMWDPFCGAGTELMERHGAGPYKALIGSDIDEKAIAAARENTAAAGLSPEKGLVLACCSLKDATTRSPVLGAWIKPKSVTAIVTNPPLGRRVARGSADVLLLALVQRAGEVLCRGGRLAWVVPMGVNLDEAYKSHGLTQRSRQSIDMGGFHAALVLLEKN